MTDMNQIPADITPTAQDIQVNEQSLQADTAEAETETTLGFDTLGLAKPLLIALDKSGYSTPTPIQAQAIPLAMAGNDLLLSAQTGSGKTAAFVLPILDKLAKTPKTPKIDDEQKGEFSTKSANRHQKIMTKALILTPTRELALQVQDNVRNYGGALKGVFSVPLVGGAPYGGQIRALRKGVQIIVATPGRLLDHINDERVDLSELEMLVLDEADRMLDMGFSDAINAILAKTPANRQTIMSSATWDGPVGKIAASFTTDPKSVSIKVETAHIEESVYYCDDFGHKNQLLLEILNSPDIDQAVIFAATKRSSEKLAEDLVDKGYKARYLHGDLPQGKRNRIIQDVKAGKCQFLIATDVAARGIDIATISHVINYDLPRQVEDYVHRIGRSGRAGRTGVAINLCSLDDKNQLREIGRYLKRHMTVATVEGLEPKKLALFESDDRRGKKDGRGRGRGRGEGRGFGGGRTGDRRGGFGEQRSRRFEGEREFGRGERRFEGERRREFGQGERSFEGNRSFQREDNRFRGERRFDDRRQDREFGNRHDNRQGEQGFAKPYGDKPRFNKGGDAGYRGEGYRGHSNAGERSERGEYRSEHRGEYRGDRGNREERGYQSRFEGSRFEDKPRFAREGSKDGFGKKSFEGKRTESRSYGKPSTSKGFGKKSHTVEEVFFAKRQAKKARKFGDA